MDDQLGNASATGLPLSHTVEPGADEIIQQLTHVDPDGSPPRAALEAAIALRQEIVPRLLDEICLAPVDVQARHRSAPAGKVYFLHTAAFVLLGHFRETRAFHLMLDYFASDSDLAAELSAENLSGLLPSILVRCYDGSSLSHVRVLIETSAFEPLFRFDCLQAWHGLVLTGRAPREDLIALVRKLLTVPADALPDRWYGWLALGAAQLREPSLRPAIESLLDRGLDHEPGGVALVETKDIESIYSGRGGTIEEVVLRTSFYEDFVGGVCRDFFYPRTSRRDLDGAADDAVDGSVDNRPYVRSEPKIGRNDLCHCGSGRKYKRCCLH